MKKETINSNFDLLTISLGKYVPIHLISLLNNFYYIFRRHYLRILKNTDSENVTTQIHNFECRFCAQAQ